MSPSTAPKTAAEPMHHYLETLRGTSWYPYLGAVAACAVATILAWFISAILSTGNLALLYITAVVLVAVNMGTRAALLCSFLNFLALNFFFTEPRGTLVMIRTEDIVTVLWFLVVAAVVGHLTARLQQKLDVLEGREHFERVEKKLLQELAQAIGEDEVAAALCRALERRSDAACHYLPLDGNELDRQRLDPAVPSAVTERVDSMLAVYGRDGLIPVVKNANGVIAPLGNGVTVNGFVFLALNAARISTALYEDMNTLVQQASLALARTRMATEARENEAQPQLDQSEGNRPFTR